MNGCAGCGPGMGAGLEWIGKTAGAAADIVGIASGAPKQAERAARNAMLAAQATAGAAGQTAAAQVEIARIQAETARLAAGQQGGGSKTTMIIAGVGVLAVLAVGGYLLLKK